MIQLLIVALTICVCKFVYVSSSHIFWPVFRKWVDN